MIELRLGDLFDAGKQVLAHQVNTRGVFGGLAQAVFERYPFSYSQCVALCKEKPPEELQGTCFLTYEKDVVIANLFGQVEPGADTRLPLLVSAIDSLKDQMVALNMTSVAFPYLIGAGIGGGNHFQIMKALVSVFNPAEQGAAICLKSEIYWNKKTGLSPVFEVWTEAFKQGVKDAGCFYPVKMKDCLDNGWSTTNKHVPLLTVWFGGYTCGREFGKKHIGEVHV